MVGTFRSTARAVIALSFTVSMAALPPRVVQAQPTTVTFNSLTESSPGSGTRFVSNCYMESGFVFTAVGVACTGAASEDAFVAGGPNSPIFGGGSTPSFLLNTPEASLIDVTRSGGGLFSLTSIELAPFFDANTTVMFTGMGMGGSMPTQSFVLPGTQMAFQSFAFDPAFAGLSSVRIMATNEFGEPLVRFDNLAATAQQSVVPEPSTVLLLGAGLVGMAVTTLRRRNRA